MNTTDKSKHARKRRILNWAFSNKALYSAKGFILRHFDRWIDILLDPSNIQAEKLGWTEPMNWAEIVNCLVFDILGELCFGAAFNSKEQGPQSLKQMPRLIMQWMWFR